MREVFSLSIIVLLILVPYVTAVPARPVPFNLTQPGGEVLTARLIGDENGYRIETLGGQRIEKNDAGYWVNAESSENPKRVQRGDLPLARPAAMMVGKGASADVASVANGSRNILVVLINFTDNPRIDSSRYVATHYENMLFNSSNNMSMYSYYNETSYGMLNLTGTVTSQWYTSDYAESHYGADTGYPDFTDDANGCIFNLAREALVKADGDIDYSAYDANSDGIIQGSELAIVIVHAGCGEEDGSCTGENTAWSQNSIWSHQWTIYSTSWCPFGCSCLSTLTLDGVRLSQIGNEDVGTYNMLAENSPMGTFAHEFGHTLGLPDLYDTDYGSQGIGRWGLIGSGSWLGPSSDGSYPAHPTAWSKYLLGWVNPQRITSITYDEEIRQAEYNDDVYMLGSNGADTPGNLDWSSGVGGTGEYFLIENRQKVGFDSYLPGSGLLIYHVDETRPNNDNQNQRLVDVEEAHGGVQNLDYDSDHGSYNKGDASDPFYRGNSDLFNDTTDPNSNYYNGSSGLSLYDVSTSAASMTLDFLAFGTANLISLSGNVTPTSGNATTLFNYTVNYTHGNNTAPASINVTVDGVSYAMAEANASDTNYSGGKIYYYNTSLSLYWHNYSFTAFDGAFTRTTNTMQGPYVTNLTGPFVDTSLSPAADNGVKSNYPTLMFRSDNVIDVGNDSAYNSVQRMYALFNVSAIAQDSATIVSAVLYITRVLAFNENAGAYGMYQPTSSWSVTDLSWNTQPNAMYAVTGTNVSETFAFNITSLVQGWVDNESSNYGASIRKLDESVAGYGTFASSENSNAAIRPMLNITYQNNTQDTTAPTINVTSPANDSYQGANVTFSYLAGDFWSLSNCSLYGNFTGSWSMNQTDAGVANNTMSNFTITLADGIYLWAIKCYDTKNNSGFSENFTVKVDGTPPSAPTLISPLGTSTNEMPTFAWSPAVDNFELAFYTLQVSNSSLFSVTSYTANITATNHTIDTTLNDALHFWRVQAVDNASNTGDFSTSNLSVKTIKINEFLPRPNATMAEFVELYNPRNVSYNLSGWVLGNPLANYTILYNISAASFLALNESLTGISLNETNDSIMLWEPNGFLVDNISFYDGQTFGNMTYNSSMFMSIGRSDDGGENFTAFNESFVTMGTSNIGTARVEISLLIGWNLISIPVVPS